MPCLLLNCEQQLRTETCRPGIADPLQSLRTAVGISDSYGRCQRGPAGSSNTCSRLPLLSSVFECHCL